MKYQTEFIQNPTTVDGFTDYVSEENFFLIVNLDGLVEKSVGENFIVDVKADLPTLAISRLSDFENYLAEAIKKHNLPSNISLAAGYLKDKLLYIKTIGDGKIEIERTGEKATLVSKNQAASGYIQENDLLFFSVSQMLESSKLVVDFSVISVEDEPVFTYENETKKSLKDYYLQFGKKRRITFITVFILFIILLWSVVLGYQRRESSMVSAKINSEKTAIIQLLASSEEIAELNIDRAILNLSKAKEKYSALKNSYPKEKKLEEINTLISETEKKILKKENKNFTEFFDLTIDNNKASGEKLYLNEDNLVILDKTQGIIYSLSLANKSLNKYQSSEIKKANMIACYEESAFFFVPQYGVYEINSEGKTKKIIDLDKDWKEVADLWIYNGNIYLTDKGSDEIYKYLVTDNGYSGKTSYFQSGQSVDLGWVNSMAIDSSLYLGGGSNVIKFTSGLRDGFKMNLPVTSFNFNKIFTTKQLDNFYAWDKSSAVIYVMDKDGAFKSQINSTILGKASDIVIYDETIFALQGSKIYKVE